MKKFISLTLALVFALVLCVPAMAATQAELLAQIEAASVDATYKTMAKDMVSAMTEAEAGKVDVAAVKAVAKDLQAKKDAGTVTADVINTAVGQINNALDGAATISVADVSVDTTTGAITAKVTATTAGGVTPPSANGATVTGTMTATTSPAAPAPSVIKATGLNLGAVAAILAIAVAGILGTAVYKSRKLNACA